MISGTVTVGQTLTCAPGTYRNTPTSYTYQWTRDGVNISGATASTYALVTADANTAIRCVVIPTNIHGDGYAQTALPVKTGAIAPDAAATAPALWLEADNLALADAAAIATISGKAPGSTAAFAESNAARRPMFKTLIRNDRPIIRWSSLSDGGGDGLSNTAFAMASGDRTAIFVINPIEGAISYYLDSNGSSKRFIFAHDANLTGLVGMFDGTWRTLAGVPKVSGWQIMSYEMVGANCAICRNGTLLGNVTYSGGALGGAANTTMWGSHNAFANSFQGDMPLGLLYPAALGADLIPVIRGLGNKYGIVTA